MYAILTMEEGNKSLGGEMDCSRCAQWNNGRGKPACLKCKQYKDLQIKSVKRQSIKTEHVPDAILENIADPRTRDLIDIIRQMPTKYGVPMVMRSVLNMTVKEIAVYHNLSESALSQNITKGIKIIQQSLRDA
jgi:hypothetical protein